MHGAVPNAAIDLLRIAAFAYSADQMVSRPVNTDVTGEKWKRTFVLLVPVLEPDLWRNPEVLRALTRTLNYGTDDEWAFQFEPARQFETQPHLLEADPANLGQPDSVLLFSGGADSLCAAVDEAARGRRPMLISRSPSPRLKGQQESLRKSLQGSSFSWQFPRFAVEVNKVATAERERTQRSRGFLYSSIGASVAAAFHLEDVVVADNGFVSVGLPLNGQTVGAKMSRTTHPRFQHLFNRLCGLVLPKVYVRNPLLFRTRAETLELLSEHGLQGALSQTSSCAANRVLPASTHCGYVRLVRTVESCTASDLIERFVELTDCAFDGADGSPADVERIVEMIRRQAETAQVALQEVTKPVFPELFSGKYPTTCLVRLSLAGTPGRKRKNWDLPNRPQAGLTTDEEKEFVKHRFNSRLPIVITGERAKSASNVVQIDGKHLEVRDSDFVLLLRLVLALHQARDGFVMKGGGKKTGGLVDEGVVPGEIDQAVERLRRSLQLGLGDLDPKRLVEVANGKIRLSTHVRFIEVRRNELSKHPNDAVRRLLSLIPAI